MIRLVVAGAAAAWGCAGSAADVPPATRFACSDERLTRLWDDTFGSSGGTGPGAAAHAGDGGGDPARDGRTQWTFLGLSGIGRFTPECGRVVIEPPLPRPDGGTKPEGGSLDWALGEYAGPQGLLRSHWQRRDGGVEVRVTVPPSLTAVVRLPAGRGMEVEESGRPLAAGTAGVHAVSREADVVVVEVGPGDFFFRWGAAPGIPSGEAVIGGPETGSEIVIRTTSRVAGAVDSLEWRGRRLIDSTDHGRQLQSAANFDVGGTFFNETFNPTEAGSMHDALGPTSTSRLLWLSAAGRELRTVSRMAFWLRPGETSGGHPATNTTVLSNHLLEKQVRIGCPDLPPPARDHAIRYDVAFTVPADEHHTRGTFEALTGYMPPEFRVFHGLAADGGLVPLTDGPGEQPLPVIASTADGAVAMGGWSPDRGATSGRPPGYGRFWFEHDRVSKWNCVFREAAAPGERLPPGVYRYRIWVAVGTRENVRETLLQLGGRAAAAPRVSPGAGE